MKLIVNNKLIYLLCVNIKQYKRLKFFDNLKRKCYIKYLYKNLILKSIIHTTSIPLVTKVYIYKNIEKLPKNHTIVRQRYRSLKTGRGYGILKNFNSSRFELRYALYKANIINYRRFSR